MIMAKNQQRMQERLGISNDELGINMNMVTGMLEKKTKEHSPAGQRDSTSPFPSQIKCLEAIPIVNRRQVY